MSNGPVPCVDYFVVGIGLSVEAPRLRAQSNEIKYKIFFFFKCCLYKGFQGLMYCVVCDYCDNVIHQKNEECQLLSKKEASLVQTSTA